MFSFNGVKSITIEYDTLMYILTKTTNNPIMEEEIPIFLKDAIKNNVEVLIKGNSESEVYRLNEFFKLIKITQPVLGKNGGTDVSRQR